MSDVESSSDDENLWTPVHSKKKYKLYNSDPSIQIPLRTLCRWRSKGYFSKDPSSIESNSNNDQDNYNDDNQFDQLTNFIQDCIDENVNDDDSTYIISDNDSISSEESNHEDLLEVDEISHNEAINSNLNEHIIDYDNDDNNIDHQVDEEYDDGLSECEMLHENSKVTVDECVFNLLDFYVRNNITKSALQQSINMQLRILPESNQMPKTVYKLFQYAQNVAPPCQVIRHYYCKKCLFAVKTEILNKKMTFTCTLCTTSDTRDLLFFHEFDISDQIRILFEKYNLAEKLKKPKLRSDETISDIVDGTEYIRVNSRNGRGDFDLTLVLNTDGLSLVKSAKSNCWPILFMIAELPEEIRGTYVIFAGLWYDNLNKPPMNLFFMPMCLKIRKCFSDGITWTHPRSGVIVNTKIVAPLVIADAPARAQLQNILNFNGRYGCNICEIKTVKCKKIVGLKTVRCYPFQIDCKIRTGKRMEAQAKKLRQLKSKDQIRGVKGYSILSCLPLLDIGTCFLPEYMHSVLLGVDKQFIGIWFDKKGLWNIKKKKEEIDNFISNIRVPQSFSRLPRGLSQFSLYKASEHYNFLLIYSLPTLVTHLSEKYFQHWLLLVIAIFNLVKTTITENDLEESTRLLELFVSQIENLYGDRNLTYNCHQLVHLPLCVKRWGPLRSTSAFAFENYNGYVAKCVHGNKNFGQEIVNNIKITQGVQILKNRIAERENTTAKSNKYRNYEFLGNNITNIKFDAEELYLFSSNGFKIDNLSVYSRLRINNDIFTSELYKTTKTNSYTAQIDSNDSTIYGTIKLFFEHENDIFIMICRLTVQHVKMFHHSATKTTVKHVVPIAESNNLMLFNLKNIKSIFQLVRVGDYVCKQPNNIKIVW